jgi:integrase
LVKPPTLLRYKRIIDNFLSFLDSVAARDLSTLTDATIAHFRDQEARELSRGTANLSLKVIRMVLKGAVAKGWISHNPAAHVKVLPTEAGSRRQFTIPEIKRILVACDEDKEWRGLVLFALYSGQRFGDLVRLRWRSLDLETSEIVLRTQKTGRLIVLPLLKPLCDFLVDYPATDDPDGLVFPRLGSTKRISTLSNSFREILAHAGLVSARSKTSTGEGRSGETSEERLKLSFPAPQHCHLFESGWRLRRNGACNRRSRKRQRFQAVHPPQR